MYRGRNLNPVDASLQGIADFFSSLCRDKGLLVSASKGYRSALSQVFAMKGLDLPPSRDNGQPLQELWKSPAPPRVAKPPQWNVAWVLDSLRRPPYEPLNRASNRDLTLKTIFLLALASAKRVGVLHALTAKVGHTKDWKSLSFPSFLTS